MKWYKKDQLQLEVKELFYVLSVGVLVAVQVSENYLSSPWYTW